MGVAAAILFLCGAVVSGCCCLHPPPLFGAVSLIGLWVVLGTDQFRKAKNSRRPQPLTLASLVLGLFFLVILVSCVDICDGNLLLKLHPEKGQKPHGMYKTCTFTFFSSKT